MCVILSCTPVIASAVERKYHPEGPKDNLKQYASHSAPVPWFILCSVIATIWFQHSSRQQLSASWFVVSCLRWRAIFKSSLSGGGGNPVHSSMAKKLWCTDTWWVESSLMLCRLPWHVYRTKESYVPSRVWAHLFVLLVNMCLFNDMFCSRWCYWTVCRPVYSELWIGGTWQRYTQMRLHWTKTSVIVMWVTDCREAFR